MMFRRRGRKLLPGHRSKLVILDTLTLSRRTVFIADEIIEAPNWAPDDDSLIFNSGGEIWRLPPVSRTPTRIETGNLDDLNNDHVLSPDGQTIYVSSDNGHLYAVSVSGGQPKRISNQHEMPFHYYLHGISPDGKELAYVAVEGEADRKRINLFCIPAAGGPDRRLSDIDKPSDGPEYSPDGKWIYFNSERGSVREGHAQIFRMDRDGHSIEQLTFDERVNWFPHVSPDNRQIVYLSYPEGTIGHPADKAVILRLMPSGGGPVVDLAAFNGGQGTINVNSWAPDSRRLAYVEYSGQ